MVNGEVYHIFNRSIAEIDIFESKRVISRALNLTDFYRFPQIKKYSHFKLLSNKAQEDYLKEIRKKDPFVEIYSFTFMPNHYHFLLKQVREKGISKFISDFQNGFAKYFNLRSNRDGGLFKSPFKSRRIATDEELLHVSRYVHLNPVTAFLMEFKDLKSSPLTSYPYYLGKSNNDLVNTDFILKIAGPIKNYSKFLENQVDYQRNLAKIKRLILEK